MRHMYVLVVYQERTCVSCIMHASARPAHALPGAGSRRCLPLHVLVSALRYPFSQDT